MNKQTLKAEWWELWWDKHGEKPCFISMHGEVIPPWIPRGCYPSRELALADKRRFIRMIHA